MNVILLLERSLIENLNFPLNLFFLEHELVTVFFFDGKSMKDCLQDETEDYILQNVIGSFSSIENPKG